MTGRNKAIMRNKKLSTAVILLITVTILLLLINSCDDFSFYTRLNGVAGFRIPTSGELLSDMLTIIPENAVLPIDTSYIFTATDGIEPYSFSIFSGIGSIDEATGLYTVPSVPGEAVISVIDSAGSEKKASVTVVSVGEFTISPTSITLYIFNTTTFSVFGGVEPFSWSMVSGTGSIDAESGLYTAPDSPETDVVRVTDSLGNLSESVVTILSPFSLNPSDIQITVNNSYTFTAVGGKIPYVFTVVSGSGSVNPDTGEYTAPGSAGSAVVGATDLLGNFDSAEITIILEAALLLSPASVTINVDGTTTFSATGGTTPYEFTILSGDGNIGLVSGIYTAFSSTGTDIVRLTDNDGTTSDSVVTIVSGGPLSIIPASVVVEQNDIFDFYADGGSPPYIYSVSAGSGSINSASGLFTAPAATGSNTVRVTDSIGGWAESNVDIAPSAPTNLIADGTVANPDTITLSWTDNAAGEDGFIIERKQGAGAFVVIDTVGPNIANYPETGLSPNNIYGYRIKAYWGSIESEYSNESYDLPNSS